MIISGSGHPVECARRSSYGYDYQPDHRYIFAAGSEQFVLAINLDCDSKLDLKRTAACNIMHGMPTAVVRLRRSVEPQQASTPNRNSSATSMRYTIYLADAFSWLEAREENSIHAIVTDPPYGLKEYTEAEKAKLRKGRGGIWRIPPAFDGCKRSPLPRFTVLGEADIAALRSFFTKFATQAVRVLVPGGHIMIATNPLLSQYVYHSIMDVGFEKRGEIIRLVQTLRGGDRPKNAHEEFPDVSVMPRSGWEPWGLFRKPCEGRVQDNLRKWGTGGLRRVSGESPFLDVIQSAPARNGERKIAPHPSLKPQAFMRQLVRAALPLGRGVILDPFMGAGSTIAAAEAVGYVSIGIEKDSAYYSVAKKSIPALVRFTPSGTNGKGGLAATKRPKANSYQEGGRIRREGDGRSARPLFGAGERI
jgi:DNA modification methylase